MHTVMVIAGDKTVNLNIEDDGERDKEQEMEISTLCISILSELPASPQGLAYHKAVSPFSTVNLAVSCLSFLTVHW